MTKEANGEYPKSLYADGNRGGEHKVVHDEDAERAARKDGFKMIDPAADKSSVERLAAVAEAPAPQKPEGKAKKGGK